MLRPLSELRWTCVLALPLSLACSGSDPENPPPDPNVELATLCTEIAAADCARLSACGSARDPFKDPATCVARQSAFLCEGIQASLTEGVAGQSLEYFTLAAGGCRDAVRSLSCEIGYDHRLFELESCRNIYQGSAMDGDACGFDDVCVAETYCRVADACPGTCAPVVGGNGACQAGDRCAADFFCDATARRCLPRVGVGSPCGLSIGGSACIDAGWCDRSNPATPICREDKGRGSGCNADAECAGTASCVLSTCANGELGDRCTGNAQCAAVLRCIDTRCVAPTEIDQDCVATTPCGPGLTCTSTQGGLRCRPGSKTGACTADSDCVLGYCDVEDEECKTALDDAAACDRTEQCKPGRICDESCALEAPACAG